MANDLTITEEAQEWIEKAEADYGGALHLMKKNDPPLYDLVCYHTEQCVEKYLKAFLTAANERFEFKHLLEKLILPTCIKVEPEFEFIRDLIRIVDAYGVDIRYPGERANREEARRALSTMKQIREFVRSKLGLPTIVRKKKKK